MSKLYLLKSLREFYPDTTDGFVVRARSPREARTVAAANCGDEGREFWLHPGTSTCRELRADGLTEMVLRDFNAG